jgi:Sec-independent protein translocase protein TatA
MFGLPNLSEIVMILIVSIVVFGPEKTIEYAKKAGGFFRSFKDVAMGMTKEFTKAIDTKTPNIVSSVKPPDTESKKE